MQKLVETWVEAEREGYSNNLTKAVEDLNRECETMVGTSRIGEYCRGRYAPSQRVLSYMLWRVLPWALQKIGHKATDPQLDALEDWLWPVVVKDGERFIQHPTPAARSRRGSAEGAQHEPRASA